MAVTIKDIALEAGVSRGTVDRVLHNRSGVNPEVAKKSEKLQTVLVLFRIKPAKFSPPENSLLLLHIFYRQAPARFLTKSSAE